MRTGHGQIRPQEPSLKTFLYLSVSSGCPWPLSSHLMIVNPSSLEFLWDCVTVCFHSARQKGRQGEETSYTSRRQRRRRVGMIIIGAARADPFAPGVRPRAARPLFLKGRSRDVNKATRENGARTRTTRTSQNQPTDLRTEALPSCETEARAPACLYHVRMHARFAPLPLSVKRFRSGRSFVTTWRRARSLASLRVDLASRPAEIASLR